MKTIRHGTFGAIALLFGIAVQTNGQNTLQFTGVGVTQEGAIRLSWQSESNAVYRIDYAEQLIDPNLGYTVWNTLYDQYPSQGTNTFWLDTGNYFADVPIPHPKYSANRFYRLFDEGTNNGEIPFVSITSPTTGSVLSDVVTVSVTTTSSYPNVTTKLYVDGQEMFQSIDGTNYLINTCEWLNGPHTLFATARALSGFPGPSGSLGIVVGRAVSPFVPVTFSNLITEVAFSQAFFEPSLGETQEVTAAFAANVNWTLQILDDSSNAVRTVNGSGTGLVFDWDGTGDGGANIPDGVYNYFISAQTNGQAYQSQSSDGGGSGSGSPLSPPMPSASFADSVNAQELLAMPSNGSGNAVPLILYPPPFDTNSLTIFRATPLEMMSMRTSQPNASLVADTGSSGGTPMYYGASSQSTIAPTRSPTAPVKNAVGAYGFAYWDYPDGRTLSIPGNGVPFPATEKVHLDGNPGSSAHYDALLDGPNTLAGIVASFWKKGWKQAFVTHDDNLSVQAMRRSDQSYGGGELFTSVTIGVFQSHGSYGTDPDYSAGSSGSLQTYFPSGNGADTGDNAWLRMCQFGFGGSLKWMFMDGCNTLCDPNYGSMSSVGAIPLKTTHLLFGATTIFIENSTILQDWGNRTLGSNPETVVQAWFDAGKEWYRGDPTNTPPIVFRVTGYPECFSDYVGTNTPPNSPSAAPRNLAEQHQQVFP